MKTRKPARERARYDEQYKQEALELWRVSDRSAAKVAAELDIRPPLLYRWARLERPSVRVENEPLNFLHFARNTSHSAIF